MDADTLRNLCDQFSPQQTVDLGAVVDDCACHCRQHYTVENGLLNVHGQPAFDRLLIKGDLHLAGDPGLVRLPDVLAVTGSVYLPDCINLKIMPSHMIVGGNVNLSRTRIRELPSSLIVAGTVDVRECDKLVGLPSGLRAAAVDASYCASLTRVAPGIAIHSLNLSGGPITTLPAELALNELKLRHCPDLVDVPEGVVVQKLIDVTGCGRLFTLPRSLQPQMAITDGILFAKDCLVLPKMSEVEGAMCLGAKAIHAFPHHHLKNLEGMQETVRSIEHKLKQHPYGRTFAILSNARVGTRGNEFYGSLKLRLDVPSVLGAEKSAMKRLA
jgi:hypothetical protein